MERVLFDVTPAWELAARLGTTGRELGGRRGTVQSLLLDADEGSHDIGRLLGQARDWCDVVADDLRWRLDFLAQCQVDLPNPTVSNLEDGRVEYWTALQSRDDVRAWSTGAGLHRELTQALTDGDGARAKELLDQLDALTGNPLALAGFASLLGTKGLGDLVDLIDRARRLDSVDTLWEVFNGGENGRWDQLHEQLGDIVSGTGGLLSYRADAEVAIPVAGGRILVVQMQDLLLRAPHELAGLWSQGLSLADTDFLLMGGVGVGLAPLGPQVTPSGVIVPWETGLEALIGTVPDAVVGRTMEGLDGVEQGVLRRRQPPSPFKPHFSTIAINEKARHPLWLPGDPTRVGRALDGIGRIGTVIDTYDVVTSAWAEAQGVDGVPQQVGTFVVTAADEGMRLGAEAFGAYTVGAAAGGACASTIVLAPVSAGCAFAGGVAGGWVGGELYDAAKGLRNFNPFAGR